MTRHKQPIDREANLALAYTVFQWLCMHPSRNYWGTSVTDSFFPTMSTWDIESETQWEIICTVEVSERNEAIKQLLMAVQENYREGRYPTGVSVFFCGYDLKLQEIEYTPTDVDVELADAAYKRDQLKIDAHIADMKARGVWRLHDVQPALTDES